MWPFGAASQWHLLNMNQDGKAQREKRSISKASRGSEAFGGGVEEVERVLPRAAPAYGGDGCGEASQTEARVAQKKGALKGKFINT